ncbi:conserved domain protein [Paraprevotella xylaniphila YIT 11841]|uniref:Conserved domain protein n=1 Tax=Paraprevotella xylaniphila YIT 11841 TaxID=762982 RepID=F3QUY3_9BACT|nr:conserved domain protein [Paraprevotella xylaniphila YIT 11841]
MTFFRLPLLTVMPFCGWNRYSLSVFSRLNIRTYGAKSESVIQGNIVTDTGCRQDIYCKQFVISCKICII